LIAWKRCRALVRWFALVVVGSLLVWPQLLRAQGTLNYVVLSTGGADPLVSRQEVFPLGNPTGSVLSFDFGFFTDEILTPGAFLDSFTITLQGNSSTAVLVTADASGVVWAPPSPGANAISDAEISRMAVMPPGMFGRGVAYSVDVPLPAEFNGTDVSIFFDLFDNQNSIGSTGWYFNPRISQVPEPQVMSFFAVAMTIVGIIRRKSRNAGASP